MTQKPTDLLEFLRKSESPEDLLAKRPMPEAPRSGQFLVVRRTQVIVAGIAAGLALILMFLLGLGLGGSGEPDAVQPLGQSVWGIRLVTYEDTSSGRENAATTRNHMLRQGLDEVTLQRIPSQGLLVVMLGSWLENPSNNPQAKRLLAKVQNLPGRGKTLPFSGAMFWSIQR